MTYYTMYIKPEELKAVSLAASRDQTRYYLNGVYFEILKRADGSHQGGIVATNGHQLFAINIKRKLEDGDAVVAGAILSNDDVESVLAMYKIAQKQAYKSAKIMLQITIPEEERIDVRPMVIEGDVESGTAMCDTCFSGVLYQGIATKPVDGKFPDFRQVIAEPKTEGAEWSAFALDAKYMATYLKVTKALGFKNGGGVLIDASNGSQSPIILTIPSYKSFYSVTMPRRV